MNKNKNIINISHSKEVVLANNYNDIKKREKKQRANKKKMQTYFM